MVGSRSWMGVRGATALCLPMYDRGRVFMIPKPTQTCYLWIEHFKHFHISSFVQVAGVLSGGMGKVSLKFSPWPQILRHASIEILFLGVLSSLVTQHKCQSCPVEPESEAPLHLAFWVPPLLLAWKIALHSTNPLTWGKCWWVDLSISITLEPRII